MKRSNIDLFFKNTLEDYRSGSKGQYLGKTIG